MQNPKNILITGATSGIGYELAEKYALPDKILCLTGRNQQRLDEITKICEDKGAKVIARIIDVNDAEKMSKWISDIESEIPLDLVIANAGISAGTGGGGESYLQIKNIFDTNIYGVINTITPAISNMKQRQRGQIAIISSMAGYRGLPSSPAYCASKAAVKVYGEGLRVDLAKYSIELSVVTPGYIKTPMTAVNNFPMPFLMDADKAARKIIEGLWKNKARIAFPLPFYFIVWLITALPVRLIDPILSKLPSKPGLEKEQ